LLWVRFFVLTPPLSSHFPIALERPPLRHRHHPADERVFAEKADAVGGDALSDDSDGDVSFLTDGILRCLPVIHLLLLQIKRRMPRRRPRKRGTSDS
jgi:hypothetical protein